VLTGEKQAKKLSADAENNTVVATAYSNKNRQCKIQ